MWGRGRNSRAIPHFPALKTTVGAPEVKAGFHLFSKCLLGIKLCMKNDAKDVLCDLSFPECQPHRWHKEMLVVGSED